MNLKGVMSSLEQSITAGGHALQNFTSTTGDLGQKLNSVSSDLTMLLVGLRGLGTVISAADTAGIALDRTWDSLASFWEDRNPFPKAAEDVEGVRRESWIGPRTPWRTWRAAGHGNAA